MTEGGVKESKKASKSNLILTVGELGVYLGTTRVMV